MLNNLTNKFSNILKKISGKSKLTEKNIQDVIREIRLSLIESDVNIKVIKTFINNLKEKAVGNLIVDGVSPREQFIKFVHDELVNLIGDSEEKTKLNLKEQNRISTILLSGLQGSGKTTTAGKLANKLKDKYDILLVSLDIYRPAAQEQLKILANKIGVDFYFDEDSVKSKNIKKIIKGAFKYAKKKVKNLIIFDTAGRIQIDEQMMKELKNIYSWVEPDENILVTDAMTGQTALDIALKFKEFVKLTGLIFTKFDSDTKGGALLSVKYIVNQPIKFIGIGEKTEDIDEFNANRIVDRIFGYGDVVKLVEKAQEVFDEKESLKLQEKLKNKQFDLDDYKDNILKMTKMGGISSIMKLIPGMNQLADSNIVDEKKFKVQVAIIQSMTKKERKNHFIINGSRKVRIAKGSGTNVYEVNQVIKNFSKMKSMMEKMSSPRQMMKMMNKMGVNPEDLQNNDIMNKLEGLK